MKEVSHNLYPIEFPAMLFGLEPAVLPPPLSGWAEGLKPYYRKDGITIFRGNCQDILARIPTGFFDLLLTDPPYGINLKTNNKDRGRKSRWNYKRVRGDDRVFDPSHLLAFRNIVLWGGNYFAHRLPHSTKWIVWDKRAGKGQNCQSDCEIAWTRGLPGVSTRAKYLYWNGAVRATERNAPRLHPTQKPIELMRWTIGLFQLHHEIKTILDPYMGVGTTLVAAKQLGMAAVGVELDEQYCRLAADRVDAAVRFMN